MIHQKAAQTQGYEYCQFFLQHDDGEKEELSNTAQPLPVCGV